jgi:hypothetical protein
LSSATIGVGAGGATSLGDRRVSSWAAKQYGSCVTDRAICPCAPAAKKPQAAIANQPWFHQFISSLPSDDSPNNSYHAKCCYFARISARRGSTSLSAALPPHDNLIRLPTSRIGCHVPSACTLKDFPKKGDWSRHDVFPHVLSGRSGEAIDWKIAAGSRPLTAAWDNRQIRDKTQERHRQNGTR